MSQLGGAPDCIVCDTKVYYSDQKTFMARFWHKKCFSCSTESCRKSLESGTANLDANDKLYCNGCFRKMQQTTSAPSKPKEEYINRDDTNCCRRCGRRVYFAEQVLNLGYKWHKSCHTCLECGKKVEAATSTDHNGELYCKPCYGRNFAPKGYGFAGGAGTMLSMDAGDGTDICRDNVPHTVEAYTAPMQSSEKNGGVQPRAMPKWGGGEYCARCSKQVFLAERQQAAGNVYHTPCFTCAACSHKLDSSKLTEKDNEIYCKVCYNKNFAPKGYGFGGGAGVLSTS